MNKFKKLWENPKMKGWIKRFGVAGFLFFFIKGLVWLAVFFGLGKLIFG